MKIPFRVSTLLLILGVLLAGFAANQLRLRYENYQQSRIDFAYIVESSVDAEGNTCNRLAIYKGEEPAGENTVCEFDLPAFQPGEMVKAIWRADQLDSAEIYTFGHYWGGDFSSLAFGLNLVIAGFVLGWGAGKKKVPEVLLGPKASTVNLLVFGVQENKSLMPGLGKAMAVYARYDPMDDAFALFPQSGKNVQPKDQLRIFKFVVAGKSKDGIPRPLPGTGSIIRVKLDLNDSHGQAYWADHGCLSL